MLSRRDLLALGTVPLIARAESPLARADPLSTASRLQPDLVGSIGPDPAQEIGILWSYPLGSPYETITVTSSLLIASHEGPLLGIDQKTGAEIWNTPQDGGRLFPFVRDNNVFALGPGMHALDHDTGEVMWTLERSDWWAVLLDGDSLFSFNMPERAFSGSTVKQER